MSPQDGLREILKLTEDAGTRPTDFPLPGVLVVRGEVPKHQLAAIYEPIVGFTVQGMKTISIGDDVIRAVGPSYYVIPTDVPAQGLAHQGPKGLPYLSIGLKLNEDSLRRLLKDVPEKTARAENREVAACPVTPEFIEAWVRMLRLLKTPQDIPALASVYEREILYRALTGPQGWRLRELCFGSGKTPGIHQVIKWLRGNFAEPLDVQRAAVKSGLAVTTFHRQFKLVTGLSPIQFQKQLRLLEARRLIAFEGMAVASAAYEVGYQSASQFNREYARFFGEPPARDTAKLRAAEAARADSA